MPPETTFPFYPSSEIEKIFISAQTTAEPVRNVNFIINFNYTSSRIEPVDFYFDQARVS